MLTRRFVMFGALCAGAAQAATEDSLSAIEARSGGRLGVAVLDTQTGRTLQHRADERFAMCSTFKLLLVAAVLQRIEKNKERADRLVRYSWNDLVTYSPVTELHVADGMTVWALCEATLQLSDNAAGNLLLDIIGGPAGWTAFARTLGDEVSQLDRREVELNTAIPTDPRDTTTPSAMLGNMRKVLLGDVLTSPSRQRMIDTMAAGTLGARCLRAGFPADWRVADKTGSGWNGTRNDIAIIFPPKRAPILACAYYTESKLANKDPVIAEVGRLIAAL